MTDKPRILIVDDEPSIRTTLETGLSLKGFRTATASSAREALSLLTSEKFDGVICDVVMPEGDGLFVVRNLREYDKDLPIILMTAQGSVEKAFASISEGASDFIAKPFEIGAVAALFRKFLEARLEKAAKLSTSDNDLPTDMSTTGLTGRSPEMVAVYKLITFAARTEATALITGESGTGKELVSRAIHQLGSRSGKRFVSVNCSGLTDSLLEAELFGFEKGAFTGANSSHAGLFESADGGTIFLDELGSTSGGFQSSLLRVLQSGEVRRVGSTETRRVDVRVIAASNKNLSESVKDGNFRSDLYYRLNVLAIELPPLRARRSDIPLLVEYFLQRLAPNGGHEVHLTDEAREALANYDFPGNVRELENALVRATALATGGVITLDCLPSSMLGLERKERSPHLGGSSGLADDRPTMDELQRRYLTLVLGDVGGNRRRAAERLGLDRRTIQRMISRYDLFAHAEDPDEEDGGLIHE